MNWEFRVNHLFLPSLWVACSKATISASPPLGSSMQSPACLHLGHMGAREARGESSPPFGLGLFSGAEKTWPLGKPCTYLVSYRFHPCPNLEALVNVLCLSYFQPFELVTLWTTLFFEGIPVLLPYPSSSLSCLCRAWGSQGARTWGEVGWPPGGRGLLTSMKYVKAQPGPAPGPPDRATLPHTSPCPSHSAGPEHPAPKWAPPPMSPAW